MTLANRTKTDTKEQHKRSKQNSMNKEKEWKAEGKEEREEVGWRGDRGGG